MELVFEIGCEDLPARFVQPALDQLEELFGRACEQQRISYESARVLGTPRRLTLLVSGLAENQEDLSEERTGPPVKAAFRDGQPTKAAEGFARGQGVAVEDLYTVDTERGEYVAAKVFEAGVPTRDLLPEILEECVGNITFQKSMRWGTHKPTFARPVRWIVAVCDGAVVPMGFANVESSNVTRGHRFVGPRPKIVVAGMGDFASEHGRRADAPSLDDIPEPEPIVVESIDQYLEDLERSHVVLDPEARRARIVELLEERAAPTGGAVVEDPELVDEVVHLVEEPHAVLLEYSDDYLELPDEVLISSMRKHQRYFAVEIEGALTNACVIIYNTPVPNPDVVRDGNHRVLKARLDDARFFWDQDLKGPFESYNERLQSVTWLQQIGSMAQRSARMAHLAGNVADELGLGDDVVEHARRAGELAKADLVTAMVNEFTDLQGVMGREYARKAGEPDEVAVAIFEQYLPRGVDDELPGSPAGACLALAEKLDALVGCFGIGLVPTSTADPYALRRASIGVLKILQERGYGVSLDELIDLSLQTYAELDEGVLEKSGEETKAELLGFFETRLENQLQQDYPAEIVAAVLARGLDDVLSVADRVEALASIRDEPDFEPLAAGFKRVVNILRKQAGEYDAGELGVDESKLEEDAERELWSAHNEAESTMSEALESRNWEAACQSLIGLKQPVDDFFDNVMVMTDDEELKRNRLAILFALQSLFFQVADLSVVSA